RGTRNMFTPVPVPKSNSRAQFAIVSRRTQPANVNAVAPASRPGGSTTCAPVPVRSTAPPLRPVVQPAPPASVAVLPLPLASAAVIPAPPSNRYWATSGGGGGAPDPTIQ